MKLIDITNSHSQLVNEQLANTDAYFIKVYSLGQTTVFYADAATHRDIVILNQKGWILIMLITLLKSAFPWRRNDLRSINIDKLKPATSTISLAVFLFLKRKKTIYGLFIKKVDHYHIW